ncbi:hypothetical protein BDR04DRAFT_651757 [Suillus decipiens]|nr:hypothetical protein BDR04DRAFT_651757 [Suillus decipiens]
MAQDSNEYLIETLGQLVVAKKEATALRERLINLEEALTEKNRLNALKQSENDELRVRNAKLESDMMQLQNTLVCRVHIDATAKTFYDALTHCQNAELQLVTKDRDTLNGLLKVSKMNVTTQQQRANTLEQRLHDLDGEKKALVHETQAAAQVVRVDVGLFLVYIYINQHSIQIGLNTHSPPTPPSTPDGTNLPVIRGPSTAGPSRNRNVTENRESADVVVVYPPSQLPPPRTQAIQNATQLIPDLPDDETEALD